ncbi:MAG: dephospho-CoA kinase [Acidobacteriota bacterium]|nr:dephospho-CoA kinase [Acidobacteriota bacterium]
MPPFVALTGGLGAGKSTALAALERLGAAVISSDAVVHELYATGVVRDAVIARFGAEVAPGGVVNRAAVAARVFSREDDRVWLEQLLWPLVRERIARWREQNDSREPAPRALVVEVPLLFEAGAEQAYDATIAVVADAALRAQRARARGDNALAEREARQLSQQEKAARSTFVVANDGSVGELESKLSAILAMLSPDP